MRRIFLRTFTKLPLIPSIGYASSWCPPVHCTDGGFSRAGLNQRKLDTVLMVSARITVLKPNDKIPCTSTNRRISREVTFTSETWQVMPMTNERSEER